MLWHESSFGQFVDLDFFMSKVICPMKFQSCMITLWAWFTHFFPHTSFSLFMVGKREVVK